MFFKDIEQNVYYTYRDTLMVDLKQLNIQRVIGKLTTNLDTGKCNIVITRRLEEKGPTGFMFSAEPFFNLLIDKVILIVDNDIVYALDWESVADKSKSWTFTPTPDSGFEKQIVIPNNYWTRIGTTNGPIIQ
ncbi:MAG: hypothetical protein V3S69_06045 [Dehalococcoidales bacterium]